MSEYYSTGIVFMSAKKNKCTVHLTYQDENGKEYRKRIKMKYGDELQDLVSNLGGAELAIEKFYERLMKEYVV